MNGRVLITGGSGLIGGALTAELAGAGYDVVILSRSPERVDRDGGLPAGARAVGWDGETAGGWASEADGARAIVNLAGENLAAGRWTEARKRRILGSRLAATRAVVAAIERARTPPEVLLQGSGVDFYAAGGDEPVDESSAPAGPSGGFLARVTRAWEAASAPAEALGSRRVLLRTAMVLAREGGALPKMALPFRLFAGGRVGSGEQWVAWIHRADEAAAIRFLLEHPEAAGPFNLAAPEPVTNAAFSQALARALGRPALLPAPAFAVRLALGEMADMLLSGRRALPRRLAEMGFRWRHPRLGEALEDLLG